MTSVPNPAHVFYAATEAARNRAQLAGLSGGQRNDLDRAMLDLANRQRLSENIVAQLARQGVPVSQLLGLRPKESLIGELRECGPRAQETLGFQLARRMAAGGWQIASGNASPSPYPRKES